MRAKAASVVDIAAYLGVTPARVRQIVADKKIQPTGQRWKAKLYDPREVFRHAGSRHRSHAPESDAVAFHSRGVS